MAATISANRLQGGVALTGLHRTTAAKVDRARVDRIG